MSVTSVRLNADIEAPLESLASKLQRSKNYLINQAIRDLIARESMEDIRWQETLEALESVKSGDVVEADVVHEWLNSWGKPDELLAPKV